MLNSQCSWQLIISVWLIQPHITFFLLNILFFTEGQILSPLPTVIDYFTQIRLFSVSGEPGMVCRKQEKEETTLTAINTVKLWSWQTLILNYLRIWKRTIYRFKNLLSKHIIEDVLSSVISQRSQEILSTERNRETCGSVDKVQNCFVVVVSFVLFSFNWEMKRAFS